MMKLLVVFSCLPVLPVLLTGGTTLQRVSCDSVPLLLPTTPLELSGRWRIEFVAETGSRVGRHLRADLTLRPTTATQRAGRNVITGSPTADSSYSFSGTISTDLRRLGALPSGDVQ